MTFAVEVRAVKCSTLLIEDFIDYCFKLPKMLKFPVVEPKLSIGWDLLRTRVLFGDVYVLVVPTVDVSFIFPALYSKFRQLELTRVL